jgi:hypothetical protein
MQTCSECGSDNYYTVSGQFFEFERNNYYFAFCNNCGEQFTTNQPFRLIDPERYGIVRNGIFTIPMCRELGSILGLQDPPLAFRNIDEVRGVIDFYGKSLARLRLRLTRQVQQSKGSRLWEQDGSDITTSNSTTER